MDKEKAREIGELFFLFETQRNKNKLEKWLNKMTGCSNEFFLKFIIEKRCNDGKEKEKMVKEALKAYTKIKEKNAVEILGEF